MADYQRVMKPIIAPIWIMCIPTRKTWFFRRVRDWSYSTFHWLVAQGVYPSDWAGGDEVMLEYDDLHTAQCPLVIAPYASYRCPTPISQPDGG